MYLFEILHQLSCLRSQHYFKYIGHICPCPNTTLTKKMLLRSLGVHTNGTPWINIAKLLNVSIEQAKRSTQDEWFRCTGRPRSRQQLRGNRFTVWRILTVLYCPVLYCTVLYFTGHPYKTDT